MISDIEGHRIVFIEACVTQGVLFILYLITCLRMIKEVKINFVLSISILLMISCVGWPTECWLQWKFITFTDNEFINCSDYVHTDSEVYTYCMWYTFVSWTNMISYNVGIWLFAMRYWTLSLILHKTLSHENPD